VRDLLAAHSADAVRLLVHSHPYHEPWEYVDAELEPADRLAARLLDAATRSSGDGPALDASADVAAFEAAMDANLNTRTALGPLGDLADRITTAAAMGHDVRAAQGALRRLGAVLGLRFDGDVEPRVREGWGEHYRRFV